MQLGIRITIFKKLYIVLIVIFLRLEASQQLNCIALFNLNKINLKLYNNLHNFLNIENRQYLTNVSTQILKDFEKEIYFLIAISPIRHTISEM